MNCESPKTERHAAFTYLTTTTANLTTKFRQKEDQTWALQLDLFNLKVLAEEQTTGHVLEVGGYSKTGDKSNMHTRNSLGN